MGFTCIFYNSSDWLSTIYASFGVLGIKWVCICVLQSSRNQEFWMNYWIFQEATSMFNFNPNSYQKVYWTTNYCKEWYFGFSFNCWDVFFFNYCKQLLVLGLGLSSNDSQVVLTFCSLSLVAPKLTYLEVHRIVYWVP